VPCGGGNECCRLPNSPTGLLCFPEEFTGAEAPFCACEVGGVALLLLVGVPGPVVFSSELTHPESKRKTNFKNIHSIDIHHHYYKSE
jgi:hypothetical protein